MLHRCFVFLFGNKNDTKLFFFTRVYKNKAYGKTYNVVLHLQTEGLGYGDIYYFELKVVVVEEIQKNYTRRPHDYKTKHLLHQFVKTIVIQ